MAKETKNLKGADMIKTLDSASGIAMFYSDRNLDLLKDNNKQFLETARLLSVPFISINSTRFIFTEEVSIFQFATFFYPTRTPRLI